MRGKLTKGHVRAYGALFFGANAHHAMAWLGGLCRRTQSATFF